MRRFVIYVLAALCLGAVFAAPASAVRESIDGTITLAQLSSEGNPPVSGSSHDAGEYKGDLGTGAFLDTLTFGPVPEFSAKFRAYFKKGTIKGVFSGTGANSPGGGGGIDFSGSGTITGGTAKYKGASGEFTFQGQSDPNTEVTTIQVDGRVKY